MEIAQLFLGSQYDIIWKQYGKSNTIYLTIDDVILNKNVFEEILNVLDKYNVKATFFVISSYINEHNYDLIVNAIKNQHHFANHGETNKMHALFNESDLENEILKCETTLKDLYSIANIKYPSIKYFRPGCGYTNDTIINVCNKLGYRVVLGSVYPCDPHIPMPNLYAFIIKNKTQPNDIIILHDRNWTPSTLIKTLPYLTSNFNVEHLQI